MRPYQSKRIAAGVLGALFTFCMSAVQDARAQAGAGKRARAAAGSRQSRTQPKEADEKARALLEEGQRRADEGKWDEALQAYRQALAIDPRYGDAYIGMGDAYMSSGKYKEGFAAYEQAISVAPWNPDAHYSLGAAYNDMARYGDAFKPFVQAIRLDPGFAEAHYGIGYAYLRLENFKDALVYLRQAVRLKPDYAEAHLALGQTHLGLRNVKAAEGELKILSDLDAAAARVLEKDIREVTVVVAQEAAQPAAPARSEQAATPPRPKPVMPDGALTTSNDGAPRQSAQPSRVKPKSAQDTAASPQRQTSHPDAAQTQNTAFELSFWESIKNSADPEEFAAYLRKYPDGQFVELARIRMRALEVKRGGTKAAEGVLRTEDTAANMEDGTKQQQNGTKQQEGGTKQQVSNGLARPSPEQMPAPATQQTPAPAIKQSSQPAPEQPSKPVPEQPSKPVSEQPSKPVSEQPSSLAAEQPSKPVTGQPAQLAAAQPLKETPVKEKEHPVEEKRAAAKEPDEAEAVTTVEDAASLLRKLFPSKFTYKIKTAGGPNTAPATSEVNINYEPLDFDGCQIGWHDSNDTLSVSLSDLDAEAVTVGPRVKPSTTFSVEVWDVTIATDGGRGAISEEKGDGSGAVNVYNGLDLQYDSRQKADRVAKVLRQAIKLCTGKM
jgi:tetratricopeptide (TPR) repeat protein